MSLDVANINFRIFSDFEFSIINFLRDSKPDEVDDFDNEDDEAEQEAKPEEVAEQ